MYIIDKNKNPIEVEIKSHTHENSLWIVVDIDECAQDNLCQNSASCVDGINSYSCLCELDFTGLHCETRKLVL